MKDIEFHYAGRNYVVVGASSGMGRRIALDLAEAGAKVLAVARNEERLSEVKAAFPDRITMASLDVLKADDRDWEAVLSAFVDEHGKCHGGVYTAGIAGMSPLSLCGSCKALPAAGTQTALGQDFCPECGGHEPLRRPGGKFFPASGRICKEQRSCLSAIWNF